ncbi:MAG: hypothetical protein R3B46_01615 [Phycisphaerales bacterium]
MGLPDAVQTDSAQAYTARSCWSVVVVAAISRMFIAPANDGGSSQWKAGAAHGGGRLDDE